MAGRPTFVNDVHQRGWLFAKGALEIRAGPRYRRAVEQFALPLLTLCFVAFVAAGAVVAFRDDAKERAEEARRNREEQARQAEVQRELRRRRPGRN